MAKSKADPKTSQGARMERKSVRSYLRRKLNVVKDAQASASLVEVLDWVLTRQRRYDKAGGGLGK